MSRNAWLHADERPTLLFFSSTRSGPARRMSSLVAWVRVTEKARLRVLTVDTDRDERLMRALGVSAIPALVLVRGRDELGTARRPRDRQADRAPDPAARRRKDLALEAASAASFLAARPLDKTRFDAVASRQPDGATAPPGSRESALDGLQRSQIRRTMMMMTASVPAPMYTLFLLRSANGQRADSLTRSAVRRNDRRLRP